MFFSLSIPANTSESSIAFASTCFRKSSVMSPFIPVGPTHIIVFRLSADIRHRGRLTGTPKFSGPNFAWITFVIPDQTSMHTLTPYCDTIALQTIHLCNSNIASYCGTLGQQQLARLRTILVRIVTIRTLGRIVKRACSFAARIALQEYYTL